MQSSIDFDDQVEWLEKIDVNSLSNRGLMLASRLAHGIRKVNGEVIQLQSARVAVQLARQVMIIDDEKLNFLFRSFLEEVLRIDDSNFPIPASSKKNQQGLRSVKYKN